MSVNKNNNGSIMIAALIVTIVTGSLVGLFLKTVTQEAENSHRSRMALQAVNIAEAGLEYAIYSVKTDDWYQWNKGTSDKGNTGYYRAAFPYVNVSFINEVRSARVYVEPMTSPPRAVAEGSIQNKSGITITRQVYIEMGNRSLFANGILAKEGVKFDGNGIAVDSYRSSLGAYNVTLNRNDEGSVASLNVAPGALTFGNADIWGRAAAGGNSKPDVGPNGSIRGLDTPPGVKVDDTRIAYDFYASLPDIDAPSLSSPETTYSTPYTIGSAGSYTNYSVDSLEIGSGEVYTVYGNVEMVIKEDVDINNGQLVIAPGASLKIFVGGDFSVIGNSGSIVNGSGIPADLLVYSTGKDDPTTSESETPLFKIAGSGAFTGAVYAPNAEISLDGSGGAKGAMFGAVVGKSITFGGGYQFHYDEDLAGLEEELAKKVTRWVELTDAGQRKNMATILTDGL